VNKQKRTREDVSEKQEFWYRKTKHFGFPKIKESLLKKFKELSFSWAIGVLQGSTLIIFFGNQGVSETLILNLCWFMCWILVIL